MSFQISAELRPQMPRLAWYAEVDITNLKCTVEHGPFVYVAPSANPKCIAACVWDGPLEKGDFHKSSNVFGTGIRVDGDRIHFVASATMIDRVVYLRVRDRVFVSNSLVVILAKLGAELDPAANHMGWGEGICKGYYEYNRDIPIVHESHETLYQVVFASLVVHARGETFDYKLDPQEFTDYQDYVTRLLAVLKALADNGSDPLRGRSLDLVSTTSRGYDSPAVTSLVTQLGLPVTNYSAERSNSRIPKFVADRFMGTDVCDDDGTEIAEKLGAVSKTLSMAVDSVPREMEMWLLASAQVSSEALFWPIFQQAADGDALTVWFAGHNGDGLWSTDPGARAMNGHLYRSAPSGFALTEARIQYGVLDCSVPFIFGDSIANVNEISKSDEMQPWRLDNDYDRPICRRLLEERGIGREEFGFGKKAVTQDWDSPQGKELRDAFFTESGWTKLGEATYRIANQSVYLASRLAAFIVARGSREKMLSVTIGGRASQSFVRAVVPSLDLRRRTLLYCVQRLASDLSTRMQ